jgi:hypothetical protein
MPWQYECRACDAVSPARHDQREDAEDDLAEHRQAAHGGLAPAAGDSVRRVHAEARGDGLLPSGWPWALLFLLALVLANCWGPHR